MPYTTSKNALSPARRFIRLVVSPAQQFEEVGGAFNTQILTKRCGSVGFSVINTDFGILTNRAWEWKLDLGAALGQSGEGGRKHLVETVSPAGPLGAVSRALERS